ncbi:hypothetical protein KCP75_04295 [Salmonella enterica subsp. enterica]|nr:hypothetical protein KCP75_04295 [Salmonella enterica subsp. enterica]
MSLAYNLGVPGHIHINPAGEANAGDMSSVPASAMFNWKTMFVGLLLVR